MARVIDKSKRSQRGVALVIALILVFMFSALAAGMMLSNQADINSLANYRFATQARFTAEAGAQVATNWFINSYNAPTSATGFNLSTYPVTASTGALSGKPIVIATSDLTSNYPDGTQSTAFQTAMGGLNSGGTLLSGAKVSVTATLLAMQQVPKSISGTQYIQTWEIASTGSARATKPVQVQVIERIARGTSSAVGDGVFATASGCGALSFSGNFGTDSWNSANGGTYDTTKNTKSGGNVGSNGNLNIGGSANIAGNYYSPLTGVGNCATGSPDAFSGNINAVKQIIVLGAPVTYPAPIAPPPYPTAQTLDSGDGGFPASIVSGFTSKTTCGSGNGNGNGNGNNSSTTSYTLSPNYSYGDLTINSGTTVHLTAGTYNLNSLAANGGTIEIDSGPVSFNLGCMTCTTLPFDFTGNIVGSDGSSPVEVDVMYAGTAPLQKLNGNNYFYGVLYAPNANLTTQINGTFDWYGAIIAKSVTFANGNANVHYDLNLSQTYYMPGTWSVSSFTWSKY